MIIVDNTLKKRASEKNPIKVAVIGTGEMGKGIINQVTRYTPGIEVVAAYNRTVEKAIIAFQIAGISRYQIAKSFNDFNCAVESNIPVITDNVEYLFQIKQIDLLIEVTGTIEFAAQTIISAFNAGKNVLSFNVEVDAFLGPLLRNKADKSGVLYSVADGDQPGVTMNLYRFVKGMGFKPLLCGNIKGLQDHYRNPDTQKSFAKQWDMSLQMATSFADGTKISFEQACIANATGMKVAKRGMLGYNSNEHIDNLTHLYDVDELNEIGGIVDYVIGAKPGPGVFVYATIQDPYSLKYLNYGKMGKGPLYSFYVPYHLLFFEIGGAICRLIDYNDPVILPLSGPVVEVLAAAKVDLQPGTKLDGIGGYKTYGVCENLQVARIENLLPIGLAEGTIIKKNIQKDQVLTMDDVEIDPDNYVFKLYKEQCRLYTIALNENEN